MILLEEVFNLSSNDLLLEVPLAYNEQARERLEKSMELLQQDVPIQQVVGWADFYGYRFKVNREVLIPRQETEELVHMVSGLIKKRKYTSLLDIGTGSGCMAISLSLENKGLSVTALDVSEKALEIAASNAKGLSAKVNFMKHDILDGNLPGRYDVIVSNPPYVLASEKKLMPANVLHHDPEIALFVADDEPLLFYKKITAIARQNLNGNGLLFFEINEKFGRETMDVLKLANFKDVELKNDLNNKPRFVFGYK